MALMIKVISYILVLLNTGKGKLACYPKCIAVSYKVLSIMISYVANCNDLNYHNRWLPYRYIYLVVAAAIFSQCSSLMAFHWCCIVAIVIV